MKKRISLSLFSTFPERDDKTAASFPLTRNVPPPLSVKSIRMEGNKSRGLSPFGGRISRLLFVMNHRFGSYLMSLFDQLVDISFIRNTFLLILQ